MAEQFEEFDDFKPAKVDDGVNDTAKKVIEKELSELEIFKADNDDMIFSYEEPKQALTEMMVEYIQNVGDVNEVNYCSFNTGNGEAIDAWGYSGDEDMMSVDLFLTVLVDPEKSNTLPKSEIERHFKWMEKFFERSQSGTMFSRITDKRSDLYQIAQLINDAEKVDRVRMFLMTNAIVPTNLEIDEKETEEGTIMEYHLWDVKRIKKHDDILRGKEAVVVDFEDKGFHPLPCIKMPEVSKRVECYLAIIPGEILSRIYNDYHQHILEQNVRTFLQFKGASNKGIRDTLIGHKPTAAQKAKGDKERPAEPDMFFSYNNGISTTATDIEIRETEQGPVITKITDWQIVNGGQTTASISAVVKMKNTDPDMIKQVFVAMKVSVIKDKETKEDLVPRISQFANTQSAVKKSDFGINEPFLQELEQQSRSIWVKNSMNKEISKWFFERTRGQYMDKAKHTANAKEEREYYAEYPKNQMFDKTTLAKCVMSWEQEPHTVCKGGEACYTAFFKKMSQSKARFDEKAFMQTIGKLILFRTIDAYYGKDGINLAGYKANMVAFTMSVLSKITNEAIDFESIWRQQSVITPSLYKYFFEAYMNSNFLVGCYKSTDHLNWIFGRTGKRDNMYNIRIGKERDGSISKYKAKKAPDFLFLYNVDEPTTEGLMMFKIHNAADTPYEFMKKTNYPGLVEGRNYVSYILEKDPITFGDIDIVQLLNDYKTSHQDYKKGEPIYMLGRDLKQYRK